MATWWHVWSRKCIAWPALLLLILLCDNVWQVQAVTIAEGPPLRILPIGDSITFGAPVEPYDGYRLDLLTQLTNAGAQVEYVGSIQSGDFSNNHNEGHRGKIIDEIAQESLVGIYAAPNVVLLHAGTNDINRNIDVDNAPTRLSGLIALIYQHSPGAVIFVAQIIPTGTASSTDRVRTYDSAIPGVVDEWLEKGKNIAVVDMFDAIDASTDLYDDLHPNANGYSKMAVKWYQAIQEADTNGWIKDAGKEETPPVSQCGLNATWTSKGEIATGPRAAYPDAPFVQDWNNIGNFSEHECDPSRLFFPDIDGDGFGDWACVQEDDGAVLGYLQIPVDGQPVNNWQPLGTIANGEPDRNSSEVFFTDLNGDGFDDYIYVHDGNVYAWINGGQMGSDGWTWNPLGVINGNPVGATRENLQMVDIDGDGRADFLLVDSNTGAVTAWLNGGAKDMPDWYKIGVIATGASKTVNDIVILGDFTGNGKADYMLVGKDGKVTGLANFIQERGFIPRWDSKVTVAEGPDGATQQQVRLVDVNGDGKVDYLLIDKNGASKLWLNTGTGGKWQIGDGTFLADLDGDGVADYAWIDGSLSVQGYLNWGRGSNYWGDEGTIQVPHTPYDLRYVRMAKLTTSGRADLITLDHDQGSCQWYQNYYNANGAAEGSDLAFGAGQVLAEGPRHTVVAPPYNWRWDSKRVQFADMDGDGLADYLYVNTNGAVLMWKNIGVDPQVWGAAQLIADGPTKGVWWTEIQFADVDGDGRTDYVHIDRISGDAEVWHNLGFLSDGSIDWAPPVPLMSGPGAAGYSIRFAEMTGDQRADYVSVDPHTGGLTLWENDCPPEPEPTQPSSPPAPASDTLVWGSIGDSYCSGVAYSPASAFDNNEDFCLRANDAYTNQLKNTYTYWSSYSNEYAYFEGCSGSILGDMHGYGKSGNQLINRIPDTPTLLIMQAGGNNCGFGRIAAECIYTPDPLADYGNAYENDPDCSGACCKALQDAQDTVHGRLAHDLNETIYDVLGTSQASHNPFYLIVPGYAQFFYVPAEGDDACSTWSFAPWWSTSKRKLSLEIRQKMNDLLKSFNSVYSNTIATWQQENPNSQQHVVFVDIDSAFEGHRFCESGKSYRQQWFDTNLWFWNLNLPDADVNSANSTNLNDISTDNGDDINGIGQTIDRALSTDGLNFTDPVNIASDPRDGNRLLNGWQLRPFHPTFLGHNGIANALVQGMYRAGVPVVKDVSIPVPAS